MSVVLVAFAVASMLAGGAQGVAASEQVIVRSGGLQLTALLWRPPGDGPFPAVLYSHGSGAQNDPRRPEILGPVFARHGYLFLYLFRRGAGQSRNQGIDSGTLMNRALAENGEEGRNEVQLQLLDAEMQDVLAGLTLLRGRDDVDTARIAAVGHSFGGSLTLLLAANERMLRSAVLFGAAAGSWDRSPHLRSRLLAAARQIRIPVFFAYAANDFTVAPAKTLGAEMARVGTPQTVRIYPPLGRTPDEGHDLVHAGVATWEHDVFAFLDEHMRAVRGKMIR